MTRGHIARAGMLAALLLHGAGASGAHAQALPPELSGDYSDLPPPPPPPPPRRRPPPPPPPPPPPVDDAATNPEFGDVGPLPPELSDGAPTDTDESTEPSDADADADATDVEASAETAEADAAAPAASTRFYAGVGFGIGTLAFTRPGDGGAQELATTPFAAVNFDARAHFGHADALSFEGFAAYQSSLGLVIETDPLFALPEKVNVRLQRLELSFGPRLRLSESMAVTLPIGLAMHLFTPEAHQYPVHPFSLGGVMLRPELIVLVSDRVSVRVGPEFQWLLLFNQSLTREGVCCSGGAIGAQASLQTSLGRVFSLALHYRELRSVVAVAARFTDVERVVTARLVGEL